MNPKTEKHLLTAPSPQWPRLAQGTGAAPQSARHRRRPRPRPRFRFSRAGRGHVGVWKSVLLCVCVVFGGGMVGLIVGGCVGGWGLWIHAICTQPPHPKKMHIPLLSPFFFF